MNWTGASTAIWEEYLAVRRGDASPLSAAYRVFFAWLEKRHGIRVLHAGLDAGPDREFTSQYLYLILATEQDKERWDGFELKRPLADKFVELLRSNLDGWSGPSPDELTKLMPYAIVFPAAVHDLARARLHRDHPDFTREIAAKYSATVSGVSTFGDDRHTVFFRTSAMWSEALASGLTGEIRAEFLRYLKACDETGTVDESAMSVDFFDDESLDRDYEGKLYYFYK